MATSNLPSFNVYTVEDRGQNEDPFWLKIGAAFAHKDNKGFNIVLSAFPLDNRLVMRVPADENGNGEEEKPKPKSNPRNRRRR
ncbi:MAG: hypothetical protein C0605_13640 [Hyphomicrobiales bacterium]|nr:MAG: hypothetical protein C0605_13640 [Hyphomicrobiales bacterium]